MSTETPETPVAATPPTPENVAEMLTEADNDFHDGNNWKPGLHAEGNVVHIRITPYSEPDEDALDDEAVELDDVHFRAVVVEGERTPIVLPAGAAADYINGDDGYHWLTCGTCETSLMEVKAGTSVHEMAAKITAHQCAESEQDGSAA